MIGTSPGAWLELGQQGAGLQPAAISITLLLVSVLLALLMLSLDTPAWRGYGAS